VMTEEEPERRHTGLKEGEDETDADSKTCVDTGDANSDGAGEVVQPERESDEQKGEHSPDRTDSQTGDVVARSPVGLSADQRSELVNDVSERLVLVEEVVVNLTSSWGTAPRPSSVLRSPVG